MFIFFLFFLYFFIIFFLVVSQAKQEKKIHFVRQLNVFNANLAAWKRRPALCVNAINLNAGNQQEKKQPAWKMAEIGHEAKDSDLSSPTIYRRSESNDLNIGRSDSMSFNLSLPLPWNPQWLNGYRSSLLRPYKSKSDKNQENGNLLLHKYVGSVGLLFLYCYYLLILFISCTAHERDMVLDVKLNHVRLFIQLRLLFHEFQSNNQVDLLTGVLNWLFIAGLWQSV